ncbi:MAG: membrane protein insertase YidC [Thermoanaerobaculia bacterium]|nr:membrane protein insertase YidC [Thermoanaerobaculia bacterium]
MDNARLLAATVLSALVLLIWFSFVAPPQPPVQPPNPETMLEGGEEPSGEGPVGFDGEGDGTDDSSDESDPLTQSIDFGATAVAAESHQIVRLETESAFLEWDNRGAQLLSYRLKSQRDAQGDPLDLVRERGNDLYPFALMGDDGGGGEAQRLNTVLWQHELLQEDGGSQTLTFRHLSAAGAAEKVFHLDAEGFLQATIRVDRPRRWSLLLGPGVGDEDNKTYGQIVDRAVGYRQGSEAKLLHAKEMKGEAVFFAARELDWISLEDNYFLIAAIPLQGVVEAMVVPVLERKEASPGRSRFLPVDTSADEDLTAEQAIVLRADGGEIQVRTYFGSKRYSHLASLPHHLDETVRFGEIMGLLSKPLYFVLQYLHDNVVANYGWCIVLTTLLIRLVFFPLTHKGQKSMTKMQELNPKVQAIRAKYKPKMRDKQGKPNIEAQRQMNEEVMALYKQAGVNPASGCLPLLLQMPVFFAFYRLLTVAVELRGAEWMLWVDDLSATDPLYILPILMGVTSVAMQRMQPPSPDPMQRRLMQIMPIGFAAFAFFFPAGLVLYWLTNNLISMLQQHFINGPRQRAARETANKGEKKAGRKGRQATVLAD